ncbi:MAG: class I SAM-dependent methyltransferase [Halobacteriales archaeon]|nr:class I SAM-dependent methyltransferase [Halobacteriales archaeon]
MTWDARYAAGPLYHGPAPPPPFPLPPGALALDLGCGAGKSLAALRAAFPAARVLGLDASRPGLLRAVGPVVQADAGALPVRDAACGAVRIHHLLGHLDAATRAACAREVERVLQPGAWLEVREFAVGDLRMRARDDVRGGVRLHHFEVQEVRALFPRCSGLACVEERRVRFSDAPRRVATLRVRKEHVDKVGSSSLT